MLDPFGKKQFIPVLIMMSLVESIGKSATQVPPPFGLLTCTYVCVDSWKWSHPKLTLRTAFFLDVFTFEGEFFSVFTSLAQHFFQKALFLIFSRNFLLSL